MRTTRLIQIVDAHRLGFRLAPDEARDLAAVPHESRASGRISHHPMGVPHGPHPGSYEKSIGATATTELAVMADSFAPLRATAAALTAEGAGHQDSFV